MTKQNFEHQHPHVPPKRFFFSIHQTTTLRIKHCRFFFKFKSFKHLPHQQVSITVIVPIQSTVNSCFLVTFTGRSTFSCGERASDTVFFFLLFLRRPSRAHAYISSTNANLLKTPSSTNVNIIYRFIFERAVRFLICWCGLFSVVLHWGSEEEEEKRI